MIPMAPSSLFKQLKYIRSVVGAPHQELFDLVHMRHRDALKAAVSAAHRQRDVNPALRDSLLAGVDAAKSRYYNTEKTQEISERYRRFLASRGQRAKTKLVVGGVGLATAGITGSGLSWIGVQNKRRAEQAKQEKQKPYQKTGNFLRAMLGLDKQAQQETLEDILGQNPLQLRITNPELRSRYRGLEFALDDQGQLRTPATAEEPETQPQYPAPTGPVEYETGVENNKAYFVGNNDANTRTATQKYNALHPINPTGRRNVAGSPYVTTK